MRYFLTIFCFVVLSVITIAGFRGGVFRDTPLVLFGDMERQPKFRHGQSASSFFTDGRADREAVSGTVPFISHHQEVYPFHAPRDRFVEDRYVETGQTAGGDEPVFGDGIPVRITHEGMLRGQKRFQIHCSVCHGTTGDGNGITKQFGMVATPTFHDDRIRQMPDGEIYNVIVNGRNTMKPYGPKLSIEERWEIVAYVRALQLAGNASVNDVPMEKRKELGL